MNINIRPIQKEDNKIIASIIRGALEDYGANKPGTVYFDPTTDDMFKLFETENSAYYIAELEGEIVGGCGIFPTLNLPTGYVELVKIYMHRSARKKGIGSALMEKCKEKALELGFTHLYLESLPELNAAVTMYQKVGFKQLNAPLGESGHFACNLWMELEL